MRINEKVCNKIWIHKVKIIIGLYKKMQSNLIDAAKYNILNPRIMLMKTIIHLMMTKIIYFWNKKKMSSNIIRNRIAQMLRLSIYSIIQIQINRSRKIIKIVQKNSLLNINNKTIEEKTLSIFLLIYAKIQILGNGLNGYMKE